MVDVSAVWNQETSSLIWVMQAIDPATGQPPVDPTVGFLPPNRQPPEGEGSVFFTVLPKQGLSTGTRISDTAEIVFDEHATVVTGEWFNTIDVSKPESAGQPLPASSDTGRSR
jgi:hypothetical protein